MSDTHAESVAFVRESVIPPAPPPVRETGAIRWLRANLFATWFNAILTIVALYLLWVILSGLVPWIFNGTWQGSSLAECREILQGNGGGCFSVLRERWPQLLFGFQYPDYLRWRPVLAFFLLFVAVPPALFVMFLPRWTLIVTAIYPFLAYWLIWGGTILTPLFAALGFVAGYLAFTYVERRGFVLGLAAGVVAALLVWWFGGLLADEFRRVLRLEAVVSRAMGGFMLNLILGIVCVSLSLPIGILLALGRQSRLPVVKGFCVVFIEFVRGVPLITLLFVANVVLAFFLPPDANFDLILRVIIMITLFASAYIAEVIRGGLAALPKGQYEAADSLGLDYAQAMRLIILPQALKISIPGIVSTFIGMFKDTTLVTFVGLFDPLKGISDFVRANFAWKGIYWEPFIFVGAIFFIICFSMSRYSMYLERRLARDHR